MNSIDKNKLPYRDNVSCVVYRDIEFLLLQRKGWPKNWWKFPQGGIDKGESVEEAAIRELKEETGNNSFKIKGISKHLNIYDWNDEAFKLANYNWRGQKQKYILIEYFGEVDDITLDPNETQDYKWVSLEDLWSNINHDDKNFSKYKETIEKVLKEFNFI